MKRCQTVISNSMDESVKHYCGLFGVFGHRDAARLTYLGLYSLQHRGEEAAGIVTYDGKAMHTHKAMGLVSEVFNEQTLTGSRAGWRLGTRATPRPAPAP